MYMVFQIRFNYCSQIFTIADITHYWETNPKAAEIRNRLNEAFEALLETELTSNIHIDPNNC